MISKETIWHITCTYCKGFWSVASMDDWEPKELYCTHCGKKCVTKDNYFASNIYCPYQDNKDNQAAIDRKERLLGRVKKQHWEV